MAGCYLLPADVDYACARLAAAVPERLEAVPIGAGLTVLRLGHGPCQVAVKANAHADEPSGTVSLVAFAEQAAAWDSATFAAFDREFSLHLLPTVNPAGLGRNAGWLTSPAPSLRQWFLHVERDLPSEDREFGYGPTPAQAAHPECAAWQAYLEALPSLSGYLSLHSMAFSGGALMLVMADDPLVVGERVLRSLTDLRWPLHDEDRGGRKGFWRLGRGLWTAPTQEEMAAFLSRGGQAKPWLALNSMQVARARHGTPVCLVSELPQWWSERLADRGPGSGRTRAAVDRATAEGLERAAAELASLGESVAGEVEHRLAAARGLAAAAADWGGRAATDGDEARGAQLVARAEVATAAAALRLDRTAGRPYDVAWLRLFEQRLAAYECAFDWRWRELAGHVEAHLAILGELLSLAREGRS
jgi:hypothetical protein